MVIDIYNHTDEDTKLAYLRDMAGEKILKLKCPICRNAIELVKPVDLIDKGFFIDKLRKELCEITKENIELRKKLKIMKKCIFELKKIELL